MYERLPEILKSVLKITNYPNDSSKFISDFMKVCRQYAVLELIQELPEYLKDDLLQKLKQIKDSSESKKIILSYFSSAKYKNKLDNCAKNIFNEYIADIITKLSPVTKNKLQLYLNRLQIS